MAQETVKAKSQTTSPKMKMTTDIPPELTTPDTVEYIFGQPKGPQQPPDPDID